MSANLSQISTTAHAQRQLKRKQVQELLALADYLPDKDRVLIEHVLGKGMPVARVAKLYQRPPRQLQRQATNVIKRMSDQLFKFVALHMNTLPAETRTTARYVVLQGKSLRETARSTNTSLHYVRRHMDIVHATARLLA